METPNPLDVPAPPGELDGAPAVDLVRKPAGMSVPLTYVGAAAFLGIALGIFAGLRIGKALGAQLGEPTKVQPVFVERCADCAERTRQQRARTSAEVEQAVRPGMPATTAAEVEAMLARQAEVEHATES